MQTAVLLCSDGLETHPKLLQEGRLFAVWRLPFLPGLGVSAYDGAQGRQGRAFGGRPPYPHELALSTSLQAEGLDRPSAPSSSEDAEVKKKQGF